MSKIYTSADQLIGKTPLLELSHIEKAEKLEAKLLAKLEYFNPAGSVKDRIAKAILDDAEASGKLKPDSVIIEPNVPVIEGKMKKHPQILGVFEGVTTEDIIDFLNTNYNDGYLKIMTTPESFPKVRSAMIQTHTDMHGEWFMLFDECERTIQDAGYRGSITLPMDDFFRCKQKAMVSATPIIPSDPRFEQQGFTMKILRPTYDHKPKMLLIHTNNTVGWVRTLMGQVKGKGHPLCIFLNSTDTIHRMICTYKIEKRCKVFCSIKIRLLAK